MVYTQAVSRWRAPRLGPGLLLAPALVLLAVTYLVPIVGLLLTSFGSTEWTFQNYLSVIADASLWRVFGATFLLALKVTIICALIAYPLAYIVLRASERTQKVVLILMFLPLWTSVLVRAYAWIVLLGRQGIVNDALLTLGLTIKPLQMLYGPFAVTLGLVHLLIPFAFLPLFAVMRRFDDRFLSAAGSLGANRLFSFLLVFLPLTLPGLLSGGLIVFLHGIGYFVTPAILGGLNETTYVMLIEEQVNHQFNWDKAAAMAVILLAATLAIVLMSARSLGLVEDGSPKARAQSRLTPMTLRIAGFAQWLGERMIGRGAAGVVAGKISLSLARLAGLLLAGATLLFLLTPIFILLPLSFSASPFLQFPPPALSLRWYEAYLSRADWTGPTLTSFQVAAATSVLVTALGLAASVGAARSRSRSARVALGLMLSPAMIPTLIIAVALYFQMTRLGLAGTKTGLVVAHLVICLPIVVLILIGALRRVDTRPEMAARSLGAGPIRAFMKTTFVMIRPSIVAALLFAFLASFDDVTVALFISGTTAMTLPVKMWESVRLELDPTLAAVSSVLVLISLTLLGLSELAKRLGRGAGSPETGHGGPD